MFTSLDPLLEQVAIYCKYGYPYLRISFAACFFEGFVGGFFCLFCVLVFFCDSISLSCTKEAIGQLGVDG